MNNAGRQPADPPSAAVFGLAEDEPAAALQLSALEFDVLWESLDLGEFPLVLKVASPGRTHTERRRLVEQAWQGLAQRGLHREGPDHQRLVALVRLLARPARAIDGRLWFGQRLGNLRVLVASDGSDAVFAALHPDGLRLREAAATGLAREALTTLPALPAGPGESVTVPSRQLTAAADGASSPTEFAAALRREGVRARDADLLAGMLMRIRRQGQFGAAIRDRWGHRSRARRVLSVFDTREGRYLQTRSETEPGAEPWTTISPADARLITSQLEELLAETGAATPR